MLGEPSRNVILQYILNKYDVSIASTGAPSITLEEIQTTIQEIFPIGSELIINMLNAELDKMQS